MLTQGALPANKYIPQRQGGTFGKVKKAMGGRGGGGRTDRCSDTLSGTCRARTAAAAVSAAAAQRDARVGLQKLPHDVLPPTFSWPAGWASVHYGSVFHRETYSSRTQDTDDISRCPPSEDKAFSLDINAERFPANSYDSFCFKIFLLTFILYIIRSHKLDCITYAIIYSTDIPLTYGINISK